MRGKRHTSTAAGRGRRITPADAGKTLTIAALALIGEDHPRGCGENTANKFENPTDGGSPPRMRGKHISATILTESVRITPADAGKTARLDCPARYRGDHPRGCGENIPVHIRCSAVAGSPPRMRGKLCYCSYR